MDEPLKGKYRNAKVFIRVFPAEKINWDFVKIARDKKSIYCRCMQCYNKAKDRNVRNYWHFKTDGVFYNCSQKEIYASVTSGVIERTFKGHNAIILAYGQSGTGKSLTTLGLNNSHQDCGIAPRIIADIFSYARSRTDSAKITMSISCLEITNTRFVDLLDTELKLKDQSAVQFVSRLIVKNENDALSALYKAEGRRQFVEKISYESHKTNFVMTLEVTIKRTQITRGKLHVVDLAGADFYGSICCTYKELFDVAVGNLAKSQLEQFLLVLCENVPEHICAKQRLNTLICYLKDSLNNRSLLRFIGHIYTNIDNHMITISMLRFAHILLCLPPKKLESNISETEEYKINYLQQRVKDLEMEKLLQSMILNTDLSQEMTKERIEHLQNLARDYVQGATDEVAIINVSHVTTFLKVFKDMYNCLKVAKEKQQQEFVEKIQTESPEMSKASSKKMSSKSRDNFGSKIRDAISINKSTTLSQPSKESDKPVSELKPPAKVSSTSRVQKIPTQGSQSSIKAPTKSATTRKASRRKSSIASSSEAPNKEQPTLVIPEAPPTHEEAYCLFTASNEYNYSRLSEIRNSCAIATDAANKEYIEEVKKLKKLNEMLEVKKGELLQAQMQKEFIEQAVGAEIEQKCLVKVVEMDMLVIEQQEIVLSHQTDLKIAVDNYNRAKKLLNEEFDKFSMDKFKTLIPEFEEEKSETIVETVTEEKKEQETSFEETHTQLQQTMLAERKKAAAKRRKNRQRWLV